MLSLATFVKKLKRKTRYGDPSNTSDDTTDDIVHYINTRALRINRRYPWHWNIVEFTLNLLTTTVDYTLGATVGDIIVIDNGNGGYLTKRTLKRYLQWHKSSSANAADDVGSVTDYMRMGYDANKCIKIKIWPTPSSAASITGYGKKRFSRYTTADLLTNTDIDLLPDDVLPVLEAGVLADIYEAQDKGNNYLAKEAYFNAELEKMVKEETVEEDSEEERPAPDYFLFHKRKRGGTCVT